MTGLHTQHDGPTAECATTARALSPVETRRRLIDMVGKGRGAVAAAGALLARYGERALCAPWADDIVRLEPYLVDAGVLLIRGFALVEVPPLTRETVLIESEDGSGQMELHVHEGLPRWLPAMGVGE